MSKTSKNAAVLQNFALFDAFVAMDDCARQTLSALPTVGNTKCFVRRLALFSSLWRQICDLPLGRTGQLLALKAELDLLVYHQTKGAVKRLVESGSKVEGGVILGCRGERRSMSRPLSM